MVKLARKEAFTKREVEEFLNSARWIPEKFEEHLAKHTWSFENLKLFEGKLTKERYERIIRRAFRDGQVIGIIDNRNSQRSSG